jgi:hypothetical protein
MPGQTPTLDLTLKNLQILHGVFTGVMVMYAYVLHIVTPAPATLKPEFFWSMVGLAVAFYCGALLMRARRVSPIIEKLRANPDDPATLAAWRTGTVLSDVFMECVVLYGVALYFTGASVSQVVPFFVVPFLTMLLLFLKRP